MNINKGSNSGKSQQQHLHQDDTYATTTAYFHRTEINTARTKKISDRMWNLHHSITLITLLNEKPLNRWLTSIVILLPKDEGRPQLHRLRIINTYESEYNIILKYFWPKQGMKKVEKNNWLGNNRTGGRKNFYAVETVTIDQLVIKTHRLTKFPLCIH